MSSAYYPKNSAVASRALKVQRLSIPFTIVGHATAASVSATSDEPEIMYIATEDSTKISDKVTALGDIAAYTIVATNSTGDFNVFLVINPDAASKVVGVHCHRYLTATTGNAASIEVPATIGSAGSGISTLGNIMVSCTSSVALNAGNTFTGVLDVDYVCTE